MEFSKIPAGTDTVCEKATRPEEHTNDCHMTPALLTLATSLPTVAGVAAQSGREIIANNADPDRPFAVYSISKTILAILTLQLNEAGRLVIDNAARRYLSASQARYLSPEITIRQLMGHTSGLPDYGPLPEYHTAVRQGQRAWSFDEYMERTQATTLLFPPGDGWSYSNIGYMILKHIVETTADQPLAELSAERLFVPLEFSGSLVVKERADWRRVSIGRSDSLEGEVREIYDPGWVAHGLFAMTASDLLALFQALFSGRLLKSESLQQMCMLHRLPFIEGRPFQQPAYGLGLMADAQRQIFGHTGGGPGSTAAAYHKDGKTAVILTNDEDSLKAEKLGIALFDSTNSDHEV